MSIEYLGLSSINGPLIALEGVQDAFYDEIVEFVVDGTEHKIGRIVEIYEDRAVIQVFEGSENMSLKNTHTKLTGHPMEYLHALLPTWDWGLTIRNLLGCAILGLSAAALPFHWRHGRKAWSTFPLVILAAFTFSCDMDSSTVCTIQLIILGITGVLTVFGVWRWHEDEE